MRLIVGICCIFLLLTPENLTGFVSSSGEEDASVPGWRELYFSMGLQEIIPVKAFEEAMTGYRAIREKQKEILTLIDYSRPSTQKRLYVLDIKRQKLLFASLVAHGKNSGGNYATSFSNEVGSGKSSLGFFLTGNTYWGKNGYSMVLDGLEKGINDRARERAIVMHGAPYCNPSVLKTTNRLGRSLGCPALPPSLNRPIIDTIKNGSVIYIFANNEAYSALRSRSIVTSKQAVGL
ncbi:MAG: murein L,D-transpeptidase catalytic domain family protein [Mangrovibacterium sp.]